MTTTKDDDTTERRDGGERCLHVRVEVAGSRKGGRVTFRCAVPGCLYKREAETAEPRAKEFGLG
jgi:hypothetical protein